MPESDPLHESRAELAKRLFVAFTSYRQNITLAYAYKRETKEGAELGEFWHRLAADLDDTMAKSLSALLSGKEPEPNPQPEWLTDGRAPGERRFYFENHHGEPWHIYASKDLFLLTGSDIDWKTVRVENPDYREFVVPNLVLNEEEVAWIRSVCIALRGIHRA
jgi:hypothetical protein